MCNLDILDGKKHIHFIGIGGSGMYPLAQILHGKGFCLTGSDNNETDTLAAVREMGIPVTLGQRAESIAGADLIVHTAAIMADNPELIAAKASGVPVLERSELLGVVTSWYENAICISGTHGKTTTTAMLTQILYGQGLDISAFIGGKLPLIHGSALSGGSDIMVCEACEFVDTFLKLYPDAAVILNIDADHLDYFKTIENIIRSFRRFASNATKVVFVNGDDANSMAAVDGLDTELITFGYSDTNDYYPQNIRQINGMQYAFTLMHCEEEVCELNIHVPGRHNILNAVAACAAALWAGSDIQGLINGLDGFGGAQRRFEKLGTARGITVCDDYAHHPAELSVTLNAAMAMGYKRVWALFQPFTFSRTAMLLDDFAAALSIPDRTVLTSIMGSREKNTYNIYTKDLGEKIEGAKWFDEEEHDENLSLCADYICENAEEGDLVITLGCGDVYKAAKLILKRLGE